LFAPDEYQGSTMVVTTETVSPDKILAILLCGAYLPRKVRTALGVGRIRSSGNSEALIA
jgi:hypothetical protein